MTHFFLFPKKLFGMDARILTDERRGLEEAMAKATEEGKPQRVEVDGKEFTVRDPKRAGREIEPA